jgi:hypothetical protein
VPIAKGESVYLSYVSANHETPTNIWHSATACTSAWGAALARMEVSSFFGELLPRLKSIELNGAPELVATTFVGGLKHLPIRYSLR